MAYQFITQYDSPNYTSANDTRAVYGRPRTIEKIAIHWWGDPATNPTFEGVIATLCNPARQASAHFVATGTGRRVACLVAPEATSWATVSANPYTISIECDPRCRDEDYDVVGELVAELRATYGNLQLMKHSDVSATQCPGYYDLNRINLIASTKIANASDQYGLARNKLNTPSKVYATAEQVHALYRELLGRDADQGGLSTRVGKQTVDEVRAALVASQEYSIYQNNLKKAQADAVAKAAAEEARKKAEADAKRIAEEKAIQDKAIEEAKNNPKPTTLDYENNSILKQILTLLQGLVTSFNKIFK